MIVHFKNKYDIHPIYKKKRHHTTSLSCCDPGGIQTLDLQNRNLTLYSLSYQAKDGAKVNIISEETKRTAEEFYLSFFFLPYNIIFDILQNTSAYILPFCK